MAQLQYRTRNNVHPQGLPKVYLCCAVDEALQLMPKKTPYFEKIVSQILKLKNCAIWYRTESIAQGDMRNHLDSLGQMQLIVMPVTRKLLTQPNQTLDMEFRYALEHHIPVLPLMQEPYLASLFNQKCGEIQFLDETAEDATAIAYMDKLDKYLDSILTDDSLIRKIRNAFDAYIFLSYRKKDRKYAQELMNMIHRNPRYRGIAIWYDEFLVPGENFNDSIFDALKKSALFALAVTPSLLENGNYVLTQEYPKALHEHKPIIPFELSATDMAALRTMYQSLPACVDPHDPKSLDQALGAHLKHIALGVDDGAEHTFLLGLAYLEGIDVEIDRAYGIKLIQSAAEQNLAEAMEKLTVIYAKGKGIAQDIDKVRYWQKKLVGIRLDAYQRSDSLQNGLDLLTDLNALADLLSQCGDRQGSVQYYTQMLHYAQALSQKYNAPQLTLLHTSALIQVADVVRAQEDYEQALRLYDAAHIMLCDELAQCGIKEVNGVIGTLPEKMTAEGIYLLGNHLTCWIDRIDMHLRLVYEQKSISQMQSAEKLLLALKSTLLGNAIKNRLPNYPRFLSILYSRLGEINQCKGEYAAAKDYYQQALALDQSRLKQMVEDRDIEALDDYALSCFDLATVQPNKVELNYLKDAYAIWKWLKEKLPFMPIYGDRLSDVESMILREEPTFSSRSISIDRIFVKNSPSQKTADSLPEDLFYPSAENKKRLLAQLKPFGNSEEHAKYFFGGLLEAEKMLARDEEKTQEEDNGPVGKFLAGKDGKPLRKEAQIQQSKTLEDARDMSDQKNIGHVREHTTEDDKMIEDASVEKDRITDEKYHQKYLEEAKYYGIYGSMLAVFDDFLNGVGTSESIEDAMYWAGEISKKLPSDGDYCYYRVYKKTGDYRMARKMLKRCARRKGTVAYSELAQCYRTGDVFKKNRFLAKYWENKHQRTRRTRRRKRK